MVNPIRRPQVLNPIRRYGCVGAGREAMRRLRRDVLAPTVLRRTKDQRACDVRLPARTVTIRRHRFSPAELDFYTALYSRSQARFDTYVHKGTLLHNYAHVFQLLSRLRQVPPTHPRQVLPPVPAPLMPGLPPKGLLPFPSLNSPPPSHSSRGCPPKASSLSRRRCHLTPCMPPKANPPIPPPPPRLTTAIGRWWNPFSSINPRWTLV